MYAIKQFYLKLFNAKTTMKDKTMMCDETKNECCNHADPPWEGPQVIPAQIRRVDNLIFRKINQFARENDVEQATPMHGWIIGYLYRHRDTPVFQRDIEREFSITRSTVTNILQLMERKGYIERRSVPQDARLKQLVLTEEGICFHEKTMLCFHQTDDYVAGLLTAAAEQAAGSAEMNPLRLALLASSPEGGAMCTIIQRVMRPIQSRSYRSEQEKLPPLGELAKPTGFD